MSIKNILKRNPDEIDKKENIKINKEIGYEGTKIYGGYIDEDETLSELLFDESISTYRKMLKDAQVSASIKMVEYPIKTATWDIVAGTKDNQGFEIRDFVKEQLFNNDNFTFSSLLKHVLTYLRFGYTVFEKVWKINENKEFIIKKIAYRRPETIQRWIQDDEENLKEIEQFVLKPNGEWITLTIPNKYLLLFINDQEGNYYMGKSLLRDAYKNWHMKDIILKIDAMRHDRLGLGIPMVTLPPNAKSEDKQEAITVCETFRSHHKGYVIKPHEYEFELIDMKSKTLTDTIKSINYHDGQIMGNILGNVIELGKTASGNRALGETLADFFFLGLQSIANYIEDIFNGSEGDRKLIKEIVDLNFKNVEKYPKLNASKVGGGVINQQYGNVLKELSLAGYITPIKEDENFFRQELQMPEITEDKKVSEEIKSCNHDHNIKLTENKLKRPMTLIEMNAGIDGMNNKLIDIENQAIKVGQKFKNKMIEELVKRGTKLLSKNIKGDEFDEAAMKIKVRFKSDMAKELKDKFKDAYDFGKESITNEMKKAGIKLEEPNETIITEEVEAKKAPRRFAEIAVSLLALKLQNEWRKEITSQKSLGIVNTELLRDKLNNLSNRDFIREAREKTRQIFGIARGAQIKKNEDQIETIIRSEILDENICKNCPDIDGEEFTTADDLWFLVATGPYKFCEGDQQCRGVNLIVGK